MAREIRLKCSNAHLSIQSTINFKKFQKKIGEGRIVCPICQLHLTILDDLAGKLFLCKKNHVTELFAFANGQTNITCGAEYENIHASPEEALDLIKRNKIKCRVCKGNLKELDSTVLAPPAGFGIKTKTRVGDIWDKAGCPEPVASKVTNDGVEETKFAKINRERIRTMRAKNKTRLAEPAGEIIEKATKRSYRDKE